MTARDVQGERRGLVLSIVATGAIGVVGVVWGVLSGSQMILLDGAYAIVGIGLSLLLLKAVALTHEGPTRRYPYGREAATPLAIGVQGLVMLGTLLYAAVEAVATIREGGSDVRAATAVVYAAIATAASLVVWAVLRKRAGGSDVLEAEVTAWRVAAFRGVGMVAGFTLIWVLEESGANGAARYVDPGMVLLTCALFVPAPVRMVRRTLLELSESAPAAAIQEPVDESVASVVRVYGFKEPIVRVAKVGPKLYVEVEATAPPETTVATEHEARECLRSALAGLPFEIWLTVELKPDEV